MFLENQSYSVCVVSSSKKDKGSTHRGCGGSNVLSCLARPGGCAADSEI